VIKVLVVDDDFRVAQLHAAMVERVAGFTVIGLAHTAAEALEMAEEQQPDLVLLDEYLPDVRGSAILRRLHAAVFVITAANDGPTIRHAIGAGALNVIVKPFGTAVLTARLEAFARFWSQLGGAGALDQPAVDRAMAQLRDGDSPTAPMPKGRSSVTTDAVVEALRAAEEPLTAIDVAESTGISRATAQRYLSDLARAGRVELSLRYGSTGRPEHRYAWRS
jgi:two-component system CitB family response regulator